MIGFELTILLKARGMAEASLLQQTTITAIVKTRMARRKRQSELQSPDIFLQQVER
jgi:hypothetical protein